MNDIDIRDRLEAYRRRHHQSQDELAELLAVDMGTVSRWERHKEFPRGKNLRAVLTLLNAEHPDEEVLKQLFGEASLPHRDVIIAFSQALVTNGSLDEAIRAAKLAEGLQERRERAAQAPEVGPARQSVT